MGMLLRTALIAAMLAVSTTIALGDDWVAVRLRGQVLQLIDGEWHKLGRGDIVPDDRAIRTLKNGIVEFQRGEESVTLGPDTAIQIYDEVRRRPFTTVKQYFGTVTVEAEVQDVQHFAVQTRYLAAVVKGTKFTVTSDDDGASVEVTRGAVFVEDATTKNDVTITAGESASVGESGGTPVVSGKSTTTLFGGLGKPKTDTADDEDEDAATPGRGKSDDQPGKPKDDDKPSKPKSDDKPGKEDKPAKSDDDDKSGKGKSDDDDNSGKGKSGDDDDKSGKTKDKDKDDDNSGKGKSRDDDDDD